MNTDDLDRLSAALPQADRYKAIVSIGRLLDRRALQLVKAYEIRLSQLIRENEALREQITRDALARGEPLRTSDVNPFTGKTGMQEAQAGK